MLRILIGFVAGEALAGGWFTLWPMLSPPPPSVHISPEARQAMSIVREQMSPQAKDMLTAQSVAWFDAHNIPRPGAIGIFCAGAGEFATGEGVKAQLHLYEGLHHYFFADTALPESRHVFNVIASFFNQELGTTGE